MSNVEIVCAFLGKRIEIKMRLSIISVVIVLALLNVGQPAEAFGFVRNYSANNEFCQ